MADAAMSYPALRRNAHPTKQGTHVPDVEDKEYPLRHMRMSRITHALPFLIAVTLTPGASKGCEATPTACGIKQVAYEATAQKECTLIVKYEIFYPERPVRKPVREYHFSVKEPGDPVLRDVATSVEFHQKKAEHTEQDIPMKFPLTVYAKGTDWNAQPGDDSRMRCKISVTRSDGVPISGGTVEATAGARDPGEVADIVKCGKTIPKGL